MQKDSCTDSALTFMDICNVRGAFRVVCDHYTLSKILKVFLKVRKNTASELSLSLVQNWVRFPHQKKKPAKKYISIQEGEEENSEKHQFFL